jgi:peptidoglycan/LPS O-acetylase OafA/YrhL
VDAGEGPRRRDIQGLRAVAVLLVVAYHSGLEVPGGFVGVDVFFAISGFVITGMLRREWEAGGRIRFGRFVLRRFTRLTPALAVMVSVVMALSALLLSPFGGQQIAARTALGTMLLSANAVIARASGSYFGSPAEANPLLNAWSLSVEEQFYLVFPLLLGLGWTLSRRARSLAPMASLLCVTVLASFALALLGTPGRGASPTWLAGFYSPLPRAWEFAAGAALALLLAPAPAKGPRLSRPAALALGLLGCALLALSSWLVTRATPFPGIWTVLPVAGTLALLLSGVDGGHPVARLLATRPMVAIGDRSYSIYLWHWPLIVLAARLWPDQPHVSKAAALFSFLPALASFAWVEQPMRHLVPRSRGRLAALIAGTIVLPVGLAGGLALGARARWGTEWPPPASRKEDAAAVSRGCLDEPFDPGRCSWRREGAGGEVLLAGDSQAWSWADGVIEGAARLGLDAVVSSRSGCPFAAADTTGEKPLDCPAWQRQLLDYALKARPLVVVIANRSSGYTRPELGRRTVLDRKGRPASSDAAEGLYEAALDNVVRTLREAAIGVVVVQGIPEPPRMEDQASLLRLLAPAPGRRPFDPAPSLAVRVRAARAETSVSARNPGTVLYDPIPLLCPDGACPFATGGRNLYLDSSHLTREGSISLAGSLGAAIREAAARR